MYLNLRNPYPFIDLKSEKRYSFQVEPPCIGQYREYHTPESANRDNIFSHKHSIKLPWKGGCLVYPRPYKSNMPHIIKNYTSLAVKKKKIKAMSLFLIVSYSSAFLSHFCTIAHQALNCLSKMPLLRCSKKYNYFITKFTFVVFLIIKSLAFNQSHKLFLSAFSSHGRAGLILLKS